MSCIMEIRVRNRYKIHIFVFTLLSIHLFLLVPIPFINKFLAIALSIGILLHIKDIKFAFGRWYEVVAFIIANAYLALSFFGYDLFLANSLYPERLLNFFTYGLGFIWTSYVLQSVLDIIKSLGAIKERTCYPSNGNYWKKWLLLFAIMFAVFMIWQRA